MKKLLLAIVIAASLPAYAAMDLEIYKSRLADEDALIKDRMCRLSRRDPDLALNPTGCDMAPSAAATARYKAVLKNLKTKAQKDALKAYLIALLSEFDARNVNSGETTRAYDARQAEARKRTKEAWISFELEQ